MIGVMSGTNALMVGKSILTGELDEATKRRLHRIETIKRVMAQPSINMDKPGAYIKLQKLSFGLHHVTWDAKGELKRGKPYSKVMHAIYEKKPAFPNLSKRHPLCIPFNGPGY